MKNSTIRSNRRLYIALSAVSYLAVWQIAAMIIGEDIFLPSPFSVVRRLFELMLTGRFYLSVLFSLERITLGFLLALCISLITACLSKRYVFFYYMFEPLVHVIKATPVASIVILILVWVSSRNLSVVIAFMMTFPILHTSLYEGLDNIDRGLVEVRKVYGVSPWKAFRYITLPQVMPFFESGIKVSLAMCFKSGIAAEIIGVPTGSIGERLYEAKVYLMTPDLFAWTIAVIFFAKLFEKLIVMITESVTRRIMK